MNQERARRHARWRLPSGVYNPVVSADGRRWRDYEQAAEAPAPSLEDRRLEVRLAALPLGVDTVTMPVVPAARNGDNGGRGGHGAHGLGAPARRRAGSSDPREAVTAATPAGAGTTRSTGDQVDAEDPEELRDPEEFGDFEDAQDVDDAEDAEDAGGFEEAAGEARETAEEAVAEAVAEETARTPDCTPSLPAELGAAELGVAESGAAELGVAESGAEQAGLGEPSVGEPAVEVFDVREPDVGEPAVEVPGVGEPGSRDSGDLAHVEERPAVGTEADSADTDSDTDTEAEGGEGEYEDDVKDPAEPGDHLETAAAGKQDGAAEDEASPAVTTVESVRPVEPLPETGHDVGAPTGHDVGASTGQDEWFAETAPAPTIAVQPGVAADNGPETGELADADDFWSAVLRDETERDWLDSQGRPRRLEETRPYGRPGGLAEADPDGQVSLVQAVSGRFPDPRGTWIRLINAEGPTEDAFRSNNAVDCALSVMSTWHGEPVVAARRQPEYDGSGRPLLTGETGGVARAEEWLGHRFEYVGHGRRAYVAIAQRLIFGGHGAAAVLITRWAGGGSHAWNAVNCRGEVLWIDAQRGHMAVEPPYEDVTGVFAVVIDRQGRRL
ncbi:toxin glutamine deamidase domain-containing protein [Microbispora rosea]|uniref:toxin glutamine deamidase domain-containing protein n=1 Tax=Microbispora rosea TaxID=58117 RepID=UPI0034197F48